MIACPECGAEAGSDQRFCGQCGYSLAGTCPACDADYGPGQKFCGQCGTTLGAPPPEAEPLAPPGDLPIIAERRIVSVMFVDLVGFTTLSEGRDPEDVRSLITEYFDLAQGIVDRFGGTVDKFIGDAVMAWWGATASQEDDAERAVRAALEIVDRVASLGERVGIADLAARAGVMTGEASVGPGGNQKGLLLGDLVNSASRVQSIARPGTVLVGSVTADLVAGSIDLTEGGTHTVKGRGEPIVVFEALRTAAERGGRGRADGLEPPFVGRTSELRLLKDMLHATTEDRRARLVSLVGQAGIGKSRLIWEFRKYLDGLVENVYWHEGRSPSYGDGIALWALAEMIRHRARIQETDDEETTRRLLTESVAEHVPDPTEREWIGARLAGLLGVGESTGHEREELFAAARAFFERMTLKGTVVLVFEDLQWADASLLEFIEDLPDWSLNHPILVVTMTRPDLLERRPDWGSGRRGFTSLYIGPLTDTEMTDLIVGTVPEVPPPVSQRIVAAAGGVPLFAVEMLRMLIGEGRLGEGSDGVANGDAVELDIPTSVQAVISARLDRLPHDDRELARDAAVLGYSFTVDGLAALRDESIDKVERRLSDLVRREILELVRDPLSPERGHYRWVQSLVREVAYGRIGRADRQALHLRAARYFRDLEEPELAPVAAAHFVAAGDGTPDPALETEMVEALQRAIQRAHAVHAHEQVLTLVDTSLDLIPLAARADLHELAAEAAVKIQDDRAADRHVEALAGIAEHQPALIHRAVALLGWVGNETRRSEPARQTMEDHLASMAGIGDDPDLARVAVYLARARMLSGDIEGGAQLAHEALGTVEKLGMIEENVDALVTLGTGLSTTRVNQGMVILRGALELSRKAGLVGTTLRALINIGFASPDPEEVLEATRQAHLEARRVGDKSHGLFAINNLLEAYLLNLELDEVARLLDDPLTSNPPPVDAVSLAVSRSVLALRLGDRQEAARQSALAEESATGLDDPQVHDQLHFLRFYFLMDDMDFESAFALQSDLGRATFTPWAHAGAATEAAAMCADPATMRQALEMWENLPTGPRRDKFTRWLGALVSISRGDHDEIDLIREVAEELRGERLAVVAVTALASGAGILPVGHPQQIALAAEAREMATTAGARGLADWVERALAPSRPG